MRSSSSLSSCGSGASCLLSSLPCALSSPVPGSLTPSSRASCQAFLSVSPFAAQRSAGFSSCAAFCIRGCSLPVRLLRAALSRSARVQVRNLQRSASILSAASLCSALFSSSGGAHGASACAFSLLFASRRFAPESALPLLSFPASVPVGVSAVGFLSRQVDGVPVICSPSLPLLSSNCSASIVSFSACLTLPPPSRSAGVSSFVNSLRNCGLSSCPAFPSASSLLLFFLFLPSLLRPHFLPGARVLPLLPQRRIFSPPRRQSDIPCGGTGAWHRNSLSKR